MVKLNLMPDESIILKSENVKHGGLLANYTDELILTNYNIIHVKKGIFGNTKNVIRFPVDQIKIYNGEPQVILGKSQNSTPQLEIYFQNGHEYFGFQSMTKREVVQWVSAITKLLTGQETTTAPSSFAIPGTAYLAETIKGTVDTFKSSMGINPNKRTQHATLEKVNKKCISCSAPLSGNKGQTLQCSYCDTSQIL